MSLEEAAALAAVTALLKSETLVPVNSNLALRLPLSHNAHTHTNTHRMGDEGEVDVFYLDSRFSPCYGSRMMGKWERRKKKRRDGGMRGGGVF